MKKIDTTFWQDFKVGDLFETLNGGKQVPTGASIAKLNLKENGETPRITVSGVNNGIIGYFDYDGEPTENYRVYSNFISVSFLGTVFYHSNEASLDMKVHCLKPKKIQLNKYTGQFLVSAIKSSLRQSSYADQLSSTVLPELYIKLPAKANNQPDWAYMEEYMQQVEQRVDDDINLITSVLGGGKRIGVNTSTWQEFIFTDLFDIVKGTRLTKADMKQGNINYIGATAFNNGVTAKIGNTDNLHPAGIITVCYNGSIGQTFYQTEPFWATDDVNVLYPKFQLSPNIAKFLCAVIFKLGQRYAYTDKWTVDKMGKTLITLPSTANHFPDWDYMEQYIETIEQRINIALQYVQSNIA